MQVYSDPKRKSEATLPDVEVFYHDGVCEEGDCFSAGIWADDEDAPAGWYYWSCFPGCLPDSEPIGPFATRREAITAAREER